MGAKPKGEKGRKMRSEPKPNPQKSSKGAAMGGTQSDQLAPDELDQVIGGALMDGSVRKSGYIEPEN